MDLSPDEENFPGRLLHQAALWDNLELLQELVASGAAVDARDAHGRSALHAAALAERSRCLPALCAAGADVDAVSDEATGGKMALHIAAERGHVENVRALLGAGATAAGRDGGGDTPRRLAERAGHRHAAAALRDWEDALERERLSQHAALRDLVSRGDSQLKARLAALGDSAGLIVNLTPGGTNTLLYLACEAGNTSAASLLLAHGADGRAHSVTRYGPLYAAACRGHLPLARLLLAHFPEAAQQETVEKWLPLHAACIGGHAALVTLLLEYPYPERVLNTYTDARGEWQYSAAFDVNARDASGQTALYVACTLGNLPCVNALLDHTVPCVPTDDSQCEEPAPLPLPPAAALSPLRSGISLGIHAIVSKLTGGNRAGEETTRRLRPVRLDQLRAGDSCVASAARAGHAGVLRALLRAGAEPAAPAAPPADTTPSGLVLEARDSRRRSRSASAAGHASEASARHCASPSPCRTNYNSDREGPWSALAVACRGRHVECAEALLAHGAGDPGGRALSEALRHDLAGLVAGILATKAYPDPDYKLNKSSVSESVFSSRQNDSALTYSALCPTTPVMVNWRDLRAHIPYLRMSWLRLASLHVNSKLSSTSAALLAITRVDVSNNELRLLPPELFSMPSLKYLNAAQNKLSRLPSPADPLEEGGGGGWRGRGKAKRTNVFTAPALQELYLQDNRLDELPPALFTLPCLSTLDVSNNKLRALPDAMWAAAALRDLNAAFNHLRDLPTGEGESSECPTPLASSPVEQRSASAAGVFPSASLAKSSSRSPSIESSESDLLEDGEPIPTLANRAGNAVWSEAPRAHPWRGVVESPPPAAPAGPSPCPLQALNLAHNQFTCIPAALACRAANLARLNMSYNSLRSMSYVTSYPSSLRQLDLSHNEITCWPSLPQLENFGSGSPLACYCPQGGGARPRSGGGVRSQLLSAACPARRHLRLEGTRTLILSNNLLSRIQLTTDDDGYASDVVPEDTNEEDDEWGSGNSLKSRLLFPLLSMLDVSCNLLRAVPPALHLLTNLAVLNVSGNKDITTLPPQMGLLSRLWSLNATGCALSEPLRSMVAGGRYKSADVVGYLKSVLHSATKYTRMRLMIVGQQGIGKTSLLECLRHESSIQHRRKPTDHWAARMGNKSSRRNMSTVGVDIGTWVYEKQRSTRGPITFRTWDFGGQQEYYATHQYFLSRRSLYLVLWRVTDGRAGLRAALHWLRSIQARAPGSPVIMVGTHYDQVASCVLPEAESPEALQRLIRSSVMGAPDADKLGLPRVMDSLEVSCSTKHNIRLLADIIYSVAYSVKPPGSKEPLLEQRIPATYLALEECVTSLAADLPEPVVNHTEYKRLVTQYMQQKNHKMFRDAAELHQATMFLHENGVLLHYDDATLKELYFLRPQWLCDVLAHVVTVREINPFAASGIMKVEDLAHVFKASPALSRAEEAGTLGVALLHKFELALCWDARTLLIPPLLPPTEQTAPELPVRGRAWSSASRQRPWPALNPLPAALPDSNRHTDSPALIQEGASTDGISITARNGTPLTRLLLVTYVPCGFWARLCSRLLADPALARATQQLYKSSEVCSGGWALGRWRWRLWRCGLRLRCGELTLLTARELAPATEPLLPPPGGSAAHPYENIKLRVKQDDAWCELDIQSSSCIELQLPSQTCVVRRDDGAPINGYQSISLEPNPSTLAKVLALISDHVDLLLEDWYPSLGTRFVHTSEGRCLITRVVPCPGCLKDLIPRSRDPDQLAQQAFRRLELGAGAEPRPRGSQESRASDGDSGVGADSNTSSRLGSVEGVAGAAPAGAPCWAWAFGWTVEQCIHCACAQRPLSCPLHPDIALHHVAPDTLLLDVPEESRARWEHITRRAVAGRGAFGTVLAGTWRVPGGAGGAGGPGVGATAGGEVPVAVKALQPVPPPPGSEPQAIHAYKAALSRWEREPAAAACRAYCGLRQELTVLAQLRHAHAVPLLAVCVAPLALLLALAPLGGLDGIIREYRGCGARLGPRAARATLLQVARALEYLHDRRIVYRDLKSENVLVWRMPKVQESAAAELKPAPIDVHVKLGDYGISRLAPPSGTKGFGGTEGFMAPEIMRYNGEEEYNEKVDCFSFGMLMYEVISGRQPFEGHEAVKEAILEGARPALSSREIEYPVCMLETMRRCWSPAPALRPSAAALVSALAQPECCALADAAAARAARTHAAGKVLLPESGQVGWELWYGGGEPERAHALLVPGGHFSHQHTLRIPPDKDEPVMVTALCRVGSALWVGDSAGRLSVFSASSCELLWSVRVEEAVGGSRSPIAALRPLHRLDRVALALSCGRLFLVWSSRPRGDSFVLTELGTARELCCLAVSAHHDQVSVWAGGAGLSQYSVTQGGVGSAAQLSAERVCVLAAPGAGDGTVYAVADPGAVVCAWREGAVWARLDCSKLAPAESLGADPPHRGRVTALGCVSGLVFVGTVWGCVIVATAPALQPLAVCRPHEADVTGILPLPGSRGEDMVATFGSGYRPLMQRYAPVQNSNQSHSSYYCLLWKAQHWLPD